MIALAIALLWFAGSPRSAVAEDAKTSVATCFLKKVVNGKEIGPKFVIGWRYREADRGAVTYSASDIHDPGNLLDGRSITTIIDGPELRMFLIRADAKRKLSPIALTYSHTGEGDTVSGGIMGNVDGLVQSTYFGTCNVKDYGKSSEAIFAALKTYGANEFQ